MVDLATLRGLPKGPVPAPITYKRNLVGAIIWNGNVLQAHMIGFGERAGNAILATVLNLVDDGTGKSGAVIVHDTNMDGNGVPLRFSLESGELMGSAQTNGSILAEHVSGKRGFRVHPDARLRLASLPPSEGPTADNRIVAQAAAVRVGLAKQPHETEEAYELRLTRNGFKKPVSAQEIAAREKAWAATMRANANDGTLGKINDVSAPGAPLEKPAADRRKKPPTDTELAAQHRKNAFSAGQEKKALANGPRVLDGPRK